jgi:hypothetical protein
MIQPSVYNQAMVIDGGSISRADLDVKEIQEIRKAEKWMPKRVKQGGRKNYFRAIRPCWMANLIRPEFIRGHNTNYR